ncbi:MAG: hypothetical protein CO094_11270 [Anaerolineae bacterium CG_4_9_14_3_um_filter_57_17]|nr:hypothetical protein [bacterium]NCT21660.1 hypothetical protein [bacterium]OIO86748.1 MAG: hypothetical protein AUK01_02300 [Anaerolineae bacterium CG2_30_57_67]PJB64939.1 MAG: hypothetical protein CO094_11270 [Anaerolineae bacterium CG_4_9_14_3_um_filter_57_17]
MSGLVMGLVWNLPVTDVFRRAEKYILLAYADHADHNGKNVFPSVDLICRKTGYAERAVQASTSSLVENGFLISDGQGPYGTNRYRIPVIYTADGAAKITPQPGPNQGGAKNAPPPEDEDGQGNTQSTSGPEDEENGQKGAKNSLFCPNQAGQGSPENVLFPENENDPRGGAKNAPPSENERGGAFFDKDFMSKNAPEGNAPEGTAPDSKEEVLIKKTYGSKTLGAKSAPVCAVENFPKDCQSGAERMRELFGLAIPPKPDPNEKGGDFALWIRGLRELAQIASQYGTSLEDALALTRKDWNENPFRVAHPGALAKTMKAVLAAQSLNKTPSIAAAPAPIQPEYDPAQRRREISATLGFDIDQPLTAAQDAALKKYVDDQMARIPKNPLKGDSHVR